MYVENYKTVVKYQELLKQLKCHTMYGVHDAAFQQTDLQISTNSCKNASKIFLHTKIYMKNQRN